MSITGATPSPGAAAPYNTSTLVAGDEFNLLAADDMLMATPAVARDRLLVRTEGRVYCLQHR